MELKFQSYINSLLKKAKYEYDPSVRSWCGWIKSLPGIYAQKDTLESTREELISTLEDYILISLSKGESIPDFSLKRLKNYAKTH